ncbi:hypothetical protein BH10PSE14_BH10PSE14_22150 [soil metagenome]
MVSRRTRRARLHRIAAAAGLVASGGAIAWALRQGFWGTVAVAAVVAVLLAISLWRAEANVSSRSTPSPGADRDDERIALRVLLDQAPGVLLAVEDGVSVRALNRAARKLFATDDRVLPAPDALLSGEAARLRYGGRSWRIDRVAVQGVGGARTLVALVDVEAEEKVAEARATRALLRVLGHEVMNAMAPITSLAESALDILDVPDRRERLLPGILRTLARRAEGLRRFAEAYRQVARLPEPTLAPVRLSDLFADLARLFECEWQGRATLEVSNSVETMASLDYDQIAQALLALLRNGAEAGSAANATAIVRLSVTADQERLTFDVSDNGRGVAPEDRLSIFMPFFTTKTNGNGIGLAAVRQIAQAHGGDAALRGGQPTTFTLSVPL